MTPYVEELNEIDKKLQEVYPNQTLKEIWEKILRTTITRELKYKKRKDKDKKRKKLTKEMQKKQRKK